MLPVMLTGVVWFVPKAVWEPEPIPPAPPPTVADGTCPGSSNDAESAASAAASGTEQRLVFKGYVYETRINWQYADTPLSTPWQAGDVDEAQRRNRKPLPAPPPPVEPAPAVVTDAQQRAASPGGRVGGDPS